MRNPYDGFALGLLFVAGVAGVALLFPIAAPRFPSVGLGLLGGIVGTLIVLFGAVPDRCPTIWRGLVGFAVGEAICGIGGLLVFWREEAPWVSPKLAASLAAACLLGGITAWELAPRLLPRTGGCHLATIHATIALGAVFLAALSFAETRRAGRECARVVVARTGAI